MVESEAKELNEDIMLGAVMFGHKGFQPVIDAIIKLAEVAAKEPREFEPEDHSALEAEMLSIAETELRAAYKITQKADRYAAVDAVKAKVKAHFFREGEAKYSNEEVGAVFKHLQAKIVRWNILDTKSRIDGRDRNRFRRSSRKSASCRARMVRLSSPAAKRRRSLSPRSAPAKTSSMSTADRMYKERFLLHYNFPPYSVGETGRMGSPGRREIGHGKLAWRAIRPMLPSAEQFPYTLRVVSEITESTARPRWQRLRHSLALMDAGVPLAKRLPVLPWADPRRRALCGSLRHPG